MTHGFGRRLFATAVLFMGVLGWTRHASAATAYGLTTTNTIIVFDTATPGTIVRAIPLRFFNFSDAETVLAISSPNNNFLIALARSHLYSIDLRSGDASVLKVFPTPLNGTEFGFDVNPIDGRMRIVSDTGQNLRLDANNNIVVDTPLSPPASVGACAYTNAFLGTNATTTTLYGIDSASDTLVRQGSIDGTPISPNSGAITTVGPLGVDTAATAGFAMGYNNQGFASLTVSGVSGLYAIDLSTGAATLVGNFSGGLIVRSLAVQSPIPVTLYGVADGNTLITFNSANPGTIRSTIAITGLQPGETIVGIDEDPNTAQLYAVGSTSRLYTIDGVTGAATPIGPGPFSPALNGTAFGVTFNPNQPFGLRVVSDAQQNLSVDARTGLAVSGMPLAPAGNVVAAAFISDTLGEAPESTLYGIDSASDQLVVIGGKQRGDGGGGAVTPVGSLGVDTSPVAALNVSVFDVTAWAALQVGGLSRLYTINLSTGAATLIGTIGTGAPVHGLTVARPGVVQFSALDYIVHETSGAATVTVVRTGSTVGRLIVDVRTNPFAGGATPGVDYTPDTQTLVFQDGVATATCSIPILQNALGAPVEKFGISLNANVPPYGSYAVVWILDDDGPNPLPSIAITSPTLNPTFTAHSQFMTLAGTASAGVVSVKWSNGFQFGTADGTTNWTAANILLHAGVNGLTVQATDASGAVNVAALTVTVNDLQYALAEGSTGGFFGTDILLANPYPGAAPIQMTYLKEDGTTVTQMLTLPGTSRTTIPVASIPGLEATAMSTFVTSIEARSVAVERTMRWDRTGYGAHTEKASDGMALTWYFAEGSQGFFNTFLLLANPGSTANQATVEFLFEDGATVTKTYPLKPTSRFTLFAGDVPELVNRSFGMTVTFAQPGMAERAMYFGTPLFKGGHDSAGATALSTTWFLAEGATGSFFTTFLELANPGSTSGDVTVTYLPASGTPVTRTYSLNGKQRRSINIAFEDPSLASAAVATQITSTVPIVAERSQYWPNTPDQWYEAHNSGGVTATGRNWALAEGRVGGPHAYQTYILLANYNTMPADVTIQFLREPGKNPQTVTKLFHVPPTSRFNVAVPSSDVPELADETFGALITSFAPIVVERAMYSDANGLVWSAGTSATATRLP
jgi:hypothetical protein